jgi:hypothetical protein
MIASNCRRAGGQSNFLEELLDWTLVDFQS